jgi:hypothetical protein
MRRSFSAPTGNIAFDAYREETLKRLEDEHSEFLDFLKSCAKPRTRPSSTSSCRAATAARRHAAELIAAP